jgi:hypothetical protein
VNILITRNGDGRIALATSRINLNGNLLSKIYAGLGRVAARVLAMPVTSCAAELNRTICGEVCIKTLSNLGLQRWEDLNYLKENPLFCNQFGVHVGAWLD